MKLEFNKNYGKWFITDVIKAIENYEMFKNGDKVSVGLSGGKDSTTLLYILKYLQKYSHLDFELSAIHIKTFSDYNTSVLREYCKQLEVPYFEDKLVLEKEDMEKSACFMCARLKRGAISSTLRKNDINKVAYGHHATDVAETFLMNSVQNKKLGSFSPKVGVPESDLEIIRPMIYLEESLVANLHKGLNLPLLEEPCKHGECNIRSDYKKVISLMEEHLNVKEISTRITKSLENIDNTNIWNQSI